MQITELANTIVVSSVKDIKRRDEEGFGAFLIFSPTNHWRRGHSGKKSHSIEQDKFQCKLLS